MIILITVEFLDKRISIELFYFLFYLERHVSEMTSHSKFTCCIGDFDFLDSYYTFLVYLVVEHQNLNEVRT